MNATLRLTSLVLVAALGLAACASDPPTRFHSLQAAEPVAPTAPPQRWVDLAPVVVPAAVDQPQWVVRVADGSLRVLEQERWVASLRDEVRAALLAGLRARSATDDVRAAPGRDTPDWRLRVVLTRFDTTAGQGVWLEGYWTAARSTGGASGLSCPVSLRETAAADPLALAAAHRRAVDRLADRIGATLASGKCPTD